jgi:2-polyprenyl-6-hydroxyphenyl methylase/3-demethylubiquinone-9 3-methyltransferase
MDPEDFREKGLKRMERYYDKLAGARLKEVYDIAPPRIKQYLEAEIKHVISRVQSQDSVLELGCGYGRVLLEIARVARRAVGIDTSKESLELARSMAPDGSNCEFIEMDATKMTFPDNEFDVVFCVQNGISAFGVDQVRLIGEALRVARPGGYVLFSSYTDWIWNYRLNWFEMQAEKGLIGEIDYEATGEGVIVCKDGFRAGRMSDEELDALCFRVGLKPDIVEVDKSSMFCEVLKPEGWGIDEA